MLAETRHVDFSLLVEAMRQAWILTAHRACAVPVDSVFIFRELSFFTIGNAFPEVQQTPLNFEVTVIPQSTTNSRGELVGYSFEGELSLDGVPLASGKGSMTVTTHRRFEMLRRRSAPSHGPLTKVEAAIIEPRLVGRRNQANVAISSTKRAADGTFRADLVTDSTHPFHFDHHQDHAPGSLLIEASRQLATANYCMRVGADPKLIAVKSCEASFNSFVELDTAATLTASPQGNECHDGYSFEITTSQHNIPCARIHISMTEVKEDS